LQRALDSGQALDCFRRNIEAQGGEPRVCDKPDSFLPLVSESFKVESPRSGFVKGINTTEVGNVVAAIGGGRVRIEDTIDPSVGFIAAVKIGDQVEARDLLGVVHCRDATKGREAAHHIQGAFEIASEQPMVPTLIKEVINQ